MLKRENTSFENEKYKKTHHEKLTRIEKLL